MKVGIKYCGGCNPRYDRAAFVERLLSDHPEWDAVLLLQSSEQEAAFHRIASHLKYRGTKRYPFIMHKKCLILPAPVLRLLLPPEEYRWRLHCQNL